MAKEDILRKAIEVTNFNSFKNQDDIPKLINNKYKGLIEEAINRASNHIEKTKSLNTFSHALKVLFDRAQSQEGLNK